MARSVIALIVAFLASAAAFVSKNGMGVRVHFIYDILNYKFTSHFTGAARSMVKAGLSMKMDFPKAVAALTPAIIAGPAFASMDVRRCRQF